MSEAQNGSAELGDVDEGTFLRFSQWAYEALYVTADHSPVDTWESEATPFENYPEAVPVTTPPRKKLKGKQKSSNYSKNVPETPRLATSFAQHSLKEAFILLKYVVPGSVDNSAPLKANRGQAENFTEVFLCHARLYVFAEKYDIQPLKALAINQLNGTLALFTLYNKCIGDIVSLVRYAYLNTANLDDGAEQLRVMLMQYIGTEMEILIKADEFTKLLEEERGSLLQDF